MDEIRNAMDVAFSLDSNFRAHFRDMDNTGVENWAKDLTDFLYVALPEDILQHLNAHPRRDVVAYALCCFATSRKCREKSGMDWRKIKQRIGRTIVRKPGCLTPRLSRSLQMSQESDPTYSYKSISETDDESDYSDWGRPRSHQSKVRDHSAPMLEDEGNSSFDVEDDEKDSEIAEGAFSPGISLTP
ncbi:hypothetical protein TWF694_000241 [Orbilia ellipsospora]|uniref:Uncharacterized protein n=1 Tax=Orbilia ellipsospora TaxID=2528407 RepID=A0AAV9XNX3_9PEZI